MDSAVGDVGAVPDTHGEVARNGAGGPFTTLVLLRIALQPFGLLVQPGQLIPQRLQTFAGLPPILLTAPVAPKAAPNRRPRLAKRRPIQPDRGRSGTGLSECAQADCLRL